MQAREIAIRLRKEGYSYSHISKETGLSRSTLSYYLRDLPYKPNKKTTELIGNARAKSAETKACAKQETLLNARKLAKVDIGKMTKRDIFMLGIGIYIGEGSKTQDIIRVVNTDYRVVNIFITWLCAMGFTKQNFTIRLHLYPDSHIRESEEYWSAKTGISREQFQKACIDYRVGKDRKRSSIHKHGTGHVTVRSNGDKKLGVIFSRRIGAWMEEVLELQT